MKRRRSQQVKAFLPHTAVVLSVYKNLREAGASKKDKISNDARDENSSLADDTKRKVSKKKMNEIEEGQAPKKAVSKKAVKASGPIHSPG